MNKSYYSAFGSVFNKRSALIGFILAISVAFFNCTEDELDEPLPEDVEEPLPDEGEEPLSDEDDEPVQTPDSVVLFDGNTNMLIGGVISTEYNDSPEGFSIEKLVDDNEDTFFITPHDSLVIFWTAQQSMLVSYYTLTSGDDRSMDPKSWTFFASDNNESWVQLDERIEESFADSKETKEFYFSNETAYTYYKLVIQSNHGGESTQIAEWTLRLKEDPNMPFSADVDDQNTNMPSGGIITSEFSDSPEGSNVLSVVDGESNTVFVTHHDLFYLLWEGENNAAVNYYTLTSAADNPEMDPNSWTLSASNDRESWTVLDEQINQLFTEREEKKEYVIDNTVAYKYYRLNVLSNQGAESTQIAEWTLGEVLMDISDLMQFSSGRSYSSLTPMGKRFENIFTTTDRTRTWLSTASNEPAFLNSAPGLIQMREFPVTLYPYGKPMPADVNQHAIGDCSALAVFASFAYLYPDFIMDIITDNGDKTFTVAMFDPHGKPVDVTVTSNFLADMYGKIGAVTGKSDRATWATVLEKAMMKWQNVYKVNEDIGGIGTEHAAPLFTGDGDSFAFSPDVLNSEQLNRAVRASLNQGKIVIGGFRQGDLPVSGNHKTVTGHAFTFMYSLDETALFSMRNPWGGENDGVLNIPDDNVIPPLIDLRIVNPGKAANYANGIPTPYTPPSLRPSQRVVRLSEELLQSYR